uniref:Uncharacterized protein n=1 Tax=Amphimedon queenslandica TaxID=400682 RepID=A0A1X7V5R4_AMPQE
TLKGWQSLSSHMSDSHLSNSLPSMGSSHPTPALHNS